MLHPVNGEWTEVNLPLSDYLYEHVDSDTLVGCELEMADGVTLLIGDINQLGGVCDDCSYGHDSMIKRVRRVVSA